MSVQVASPGVLDRMALAGAKWRSTTFGEYSAEFIGTFLLIMFGDGVVAMAVAALNQSGRGKLIFDASGDWLLITWGWCMAVVLAVYFAGGVTGAHINPAVTLANAVNRGMPWRKVPGYWAAQVAGAFVGAALVYGVYNAAISSYERAHGISRGALNSIPTYSIFATFPSGYFHTWYGPFIDELVGTALLVGIIYAIVDERNLAVKANLGPWIVGLVVAAVGMSYGANSGYAINPARDLGPRLFAWAAGYGKIAVPGNYGNVNHYMWIPIVAPLLGGLIGAFVYDLFIRHTLVAREVPPTPGVDAEARVEGRAEEV